MTGRSFGHPFALAVNYEELMHYRDHNHKELRTFCQSARLSTIHPIPHRTRPAMSRPVPNAGLGWAGLETAGELRMMMGNETVHTQTIWPTQKPEA